MFFVSSTTHVLTVLLPILIGWSNDLTNPQVLYFLFFFFFSVTWNSDSSDSVQQSQREAASNRGWEWKTLAKALSVTGTGALGGGTIQQTDREAFGSFCGLQKGLLGTERTGEISPMAREKPRCSLPVSFASRAWGTTSTPKWRGLVNDLTAYFLLLLPFLPHFLILNKAFLYHYCFYLMTYC